jgi:hypothetical protein
VAWVVLVGLLFFIKIEEYIFQILIEIIHQLAFNSKVIIMLLGQEHP